MALEDKLNQAKGALKENAGKLTGDKKLEAEGDVENTAAFMEEILASLNDLTVNIDEISKRYENIDKITNDMNSVVSEL